MSCLQSIIRDRQGQKPRFVLLLALLASGCATGPTTQPTTPDEKQDAILSDPMNYKPSMDHDVTGGDITHFGKGIDKDLNDVLNP